MSCTGRSNGIPTTKVDYDNPMITDTSILFSANSVIHVPAMIWDFNTDTKLEDLRWYLYGPDGKVVYFQEAEGELISDAADIIYVESVAIRVPLFPSHGGWSLKFGNKGELLGLLTNILIAFNFNVGESGFMDNMLAPIYITWGGVPVFGWGEFSQALPCILILSCPIWGFGLFFVLLIIWRGSFKVAQRELKEMVGKIRKKNRKTGGSRNVKNNAIRG